MWYYSMQYNTFLFFYTITMKKATFEKIQSIITEAEKNYWDLNDSLNYFLNENDLKECTTIWEIINYFRNLDDNGDITNAEVIYYTTAIEYLQENDPSLKESLEIAHDLWYDYKNLNSELLASLLMTENNRQDFTKLLDDIESELKEIEEEIECE